MKKLLINRQKHFLLFLIKEMLSVKTGANINNFYMNNKPLTSLSFQPQIDEPIVFTTVDDETTVPFSTPNDSNEINDKFEDEIRWWLSHTSIPEPVSPETTTQDETTTPGTYT